MHSIAFPLKRSYMLITCRGKCTLRIWSSRRLLTAITNSAAWQGTRIILRQVSPESLCIFDFILELYTSCSGNWDVLIVENWIEKEDCSALLDYAAIFLSNVGNYYVSTFLYVKNLPS